jgi:sugar transferase EpsL
MKNNSVQLFIKRLIDVVVSLCGLILLGPGLVFLWVLVCWKLGRPALFVHLRPGWRERPFHLIKFRTMIRESKDGQGNLLPDDVRLPAFGKFLRSTSLDELPELINVLRGDMSLVGPRPLMMKYLGRYTPEQARRHEVKPGITGWAQVNGRNAISWEEKFKLDVWYVDNWSLWLDFKILLKSVILVFKRDSVNQDGVATVDEFMGTK